MSWHRFLSLPRHELAEAMALGHAIDPVRLDDREYKGISLGLPGVIERLTWKKFKKVFHRDPATGRLRGWNVRLAQNGLDEPCLPLERRGAPITFGHYAVEPLSGYKLPLRCGPGLMLDYGKGAHARFDPLARLRDPIVALEAGETRLLLGCSYVDLGVVRMTTPSFFLLVYDGPLVSRA
jgi:hypothetical protein